MNKLKLSFYLIALISASACSSAGVDGLGQSVTVTHSYSSQTTVSSSAPTQIVQDQPQRFSIRLAVKNSTPFPVKIFFSPSLYATQYPDRTVYTFPASSMGFLVPSPDLYLSPGEIQTFASTKVGKPSDPFELCWETTNPMSTFGTCVPTDIFLGRFPASPLYMLLTIRGDYPAFAGSGLSLAKVIVPRQKKIETITVGRGANLKHEQREKKDKALPAPGGFAHSDSAFVP